MTDKSDGDNDTVIDIPDGLSEGSEGAAKSHDNHHTPNKQNNENDNNDPVASDKDGDHATVSVAVSPEEKPISSLSRPVFLEEQPSVVPQEEPPPSPPLKVNVVKLDHAAAFWDIYDALWIEMSYLVTKRIQLLEAFRDGRMFIAKYDAKAHETEHPKFKHGVTRPGSDILKSFLVITEESVLDCLWVVSALRRCNIGRQLIQGCQIQKCMLAPLTTRDFLVECGVEAEQYFAINNDRLFKDLLRMAIGFNDKIVRKLENKLYKKQNNDELESSDKKRNHSKDDENYMTDGGTPPKKKLKTSPVSETASSLPCCNNVVSQ